MISFMKRKKEKPNGRVGRILKNERRRKQGMRWQLQDGGVEDGAENDKKQTAHMWGAKEKKKRKGTERKGMESQHAALTHLSGR